ncbi:MAG TPA: zinc-binding protein [Deltaproteobacteria bacterium]|nr:zinc-binding protein [Deltaproteobacteria bacterium]
MKKLTILLIILTLVSFGAAGCKEGRQHDNEKRRLRIVTTLFPLFDFAGKVGGERVEVVLLLPPGVEPHDFEPKPKDVVTIQKADLFVYTGRAMEPWVQTILKSIDSKDLVVVDTSKGITLRSADEDHDGHRHGGKGHGPDMNSDPHIWLDFGNAQAMVGTIAEELSKRDPKASDYYARNASAYIDQLRKLDEAYRTGLAGCKTRFFLHGGHYAFNYLAQRYGLTYVSLRGVSPNAEPSPAHLVGMVNKMKQYQVSHIFYEELASPRLAETIARETGANLLPLSPGHNVTTEQMEQRVSFIDIMKTNLTMLQKGLQCK